MKKFCGVILTLCLILSCVTAFGAGLRVEWGGAVLAPGEVSVRLFGADDGLRAILAVYGPDGLAAVKTVEVENARAELELLLGDIGPESRAKLFLWDYEKLEPVRGTLSTLTPEGVIDGAAYSGPALGSVSGTVKNSDGNPLENVDISLSVEGYTTKTASDGTYGFTNVPVGDYTVTAAAPADMEPVGENTLTVTVEEDKTAAADFTFKAIIHYGSVSGTVKDSDGTPLENVEISLSAEGYTTKTASDGTYGFTGVPVGDYTVTAAAPADMEPVGENTLTVTVEEDKTAAADFTFKATVHYGSVSGTVKDSDGTPLENVEVSLSAEGYTTKTASDGTYGFTGVPVGDYTVTAAAPADMEPVGENTLTVTVEEDKTAAADFTFKATVHYGSVSGTVKDSDGIPFENVEISLSAEGYTTKTASDGTYGFDNVPVGEYTVTAAAPADMEPVGEASVNVTVKENQTSTADFVFGPKEPEPEKWYSDNQKVNNGSSIGYHSFEALAGDYEVEFELTVVKKGNNAVMLHDSSKNPLDYEGSSVILLFNGNYFSVRSGDGSGGYTAEAVNLCAVKENETYKIKICGDAAMNTYTVSVTGKDGQTHTSDIMRAWTNGDKLDSLALISNDHNTVVNGDECSDYLFYVTGCTAEHIIGDPVYDGFAGRYFAIKAGGKYVRGNNGKLSADWNSVSDDSAKFLPRDMGDGSFAFMCLSSKRRITASDSGQLSSADYDCNGDGQHWLLEKGPSYSDEAPAYYLKSLKNQKYIGLVDGFLSAVDEADKVELIFEPLNDDSPLYLISASPAYARLSKKQRERIEMIYETVAGDVFDRYSNDIISAEWTPRLRIDNIYKEAKDTDEELYKRLEKFLKGDDAYLITDGAIANSYSVTTPLPGTGGETCGLDGGVAGSYDFWRGTKLQGTKYKLTVYTAAGSVQQTVDLYVQNDGTARTNEQRFVEIFNKIPYIYRKNITSVKIRSDTANSYNCGSNDLYIRLNWSPGAAQMLCTVCHELTHSNSAVNGNWAEGDGWRNAMNDDMIYVSPYGKSNATEDFAEFGRLYFISYGNRDRQRAIQLLFPNRYASYYRMRNNKNMGGFELWEDTEYPEYSNE